MTRRTMLGAAALTALAQEPKELNLFLLAGQSNMAGRGEVEAQDREPIQDVLALNKELAWVPAVDPIHFDKPIAGVGLARRFAKTLRKLAPGAKIGLIPAALGGSSLDEWREGGMLFTSAVKRAKAAQAAGTLRGILWHQGEADSNDEARARSYSARWWAMMTALRAELGAGDLPVVVGELGEFLVGRSDGKQPFANVVNEQLALIALRGRRAVFVSAAGLVHKGDDLHFNSASLREFGRRYALGYCSLDATWGA
jgi:hypothetical protein